jgi:type IV secretory pathway TrbF-like protein
MLPKRDQNPNLPPSRIAVPKTMVMALGMTAVLSGASTLMLASLWIYEKSRDKEVYVYVVDQDGAMITQTVAHSKWTPENADWADAAMRWVENVRSRSIDPHEYSKQLKRLSLTTDKSLWGTVDQWMKQHPPKSTETVNIQITQALIDNSDANQATVKVWWREHVAPTTGGVMTPSRGLVTLQLAKGPPRAEQEIDVANPDGIYVTGFNFNPLHKEGKKEEKS